MHLQEKTIGSETTYLGKVFYVTKDTARLEDGKAVQRDVVHHSGGVCVVPLTEKGTVLMVKQFRYPMQQVTLEVPAGKLEKGEDPADCGKRELREEAGRTCGKYTSLGKLFPTPAYDTEVIHMYLAQELSAPEEQELDEGEFLDVTELPLEEAVQLVMKRDRERLRKMTFYCFTHECLRDYILRYFGEYGSNYCGNCSNCLTQFENTDITEMAKALLSCIETSRQRYGATVIIDTVHGANTAKIRGYGMNENPEYGSLAKVPVYRLRQVLNQLQLEGYLTATNDEYAILRLTPKAASVLNNEETVWMKLAKEQTKSEQETQKKSRKKKSALAGSGEFTEAEENLFETLRKLRAQIAKEEKVPPYIVFSDKTLAHMCIIKPVNKEEMLSVSGVGEFKYEKYGERFLAAVREQTE